MSIFFWSENASAAVHGLTMPWSINILNMGCLAPCKWEYSFATVLFFCFLRFEYDNANQIAKPIRKIGLLSQVLGFARRRWIVYWFTMTLSHGRRWLLWYSSFPCSVTISPVCRLSRPPPARKALSRTKLLRELLWRISVQSKAQTSSKQTRWLKN